MTETQTAFSKRNFEQFLDIENRTISAGETAVERSLRKKRP
jgi:hypothetical protein